MLKASSLAQERDYSRKLNLFHLGVKWDWRSLAAGGGSFMATKISSSEGGGIFHIPRSCRTDGTRGLLNSVVWQFNYRSLHLISHNIYAICNEHIEESMVELYFLSSRRMTTSERVQTAVTWRTKTGQECPAAEEREGETEKCSLIFLRRLLNIRHLNVEDGMHTSIIFSK